MLGAVGGCRSSVCFHSDCVCSLASLVFLLTQLLLREVEALFSELVLETVEGKGRAGERSDAVDVTATC